MGVAISIAVLFVLVAIILRYMVFQQPTDKIKASWVSFALAVVATTVFTLISNGEQQDTLITGFATMLVSYNVLSR